MGEARALRVGDPHQPCAVTREHSKEKKKHFVGKSELELASSKTALEVTPLIFLLKSGVGERSQAWEQVCYGLNVRVPPKFCMLELNSHSDSINWEVMRS